MIHFHCLLALLVLTTAVAQELPFVRNARQEKLAIREALKVYDSEFEQQIIDRNLYTANDLYRDLGASASKLSTECSEDIGLITRSVLTMVFNITDFDRQVILPMIDSAGRVGPAILKGHLYFAGHFSECVNIDFKVEGRTRNFKGAYFKQVFEMLRSGNDLSLSLSTRECCPGSEFQISMRLHFNIFRIAVDLLGRYNNQPGACSIPLGNSTMNLSFKFGVCLPSSCSSNELISVLRPDSGDPPVRNKVCAVVKTNDGLDPKDAGFYISVSIMGTIAAICCISGAVDYLFGDYAKKTGYDKNPLWTVLMAFSLYSNVLSIFNTGGGPKEGQIGPLHCIRFFSMCWVVMGHYFSSLLLFVESPRDILEMGLDITSEMIMNAYFSVDTFFFMSGILLTFIWFKNYQRNAEATIGWKSWIMFYVHRILRLSPPYYMVVLFYAFVLKQLMIGFPINISAAFVSDQCASTWWVELLYLHNWVMFDQQCLGISWYLASEMQMYLFTPLLIIPLAIKPILGFIVAAIFFTISTAANIFLIYWYHWPANGAYLGPLDPEMSHMDLYGELMYDSPLIRCQVYLMGMIVGWFLQTKKKMRINRIVNVVLWILSGSLMLTVVLGLHDQSNGFAIPIFWRAMYSAFSRVAWGIGLAWIIISCFYGYGGPINDFMSWSIWAPLGRLTYCGYLTHIPIMMIVLAQSTDNFAFATFLEAFLGRYIGIVALVFFFSIFWSSLFEISFGKLEMILLGGFKSRPQVEKISERL